MRTVNLINKPVVVNAIEYFLSRKHIEEKNKVEEKGRKIFSDFGRIGYKSRAIFFIVQIFRKAISNHPQESKNIASTL